MPADHNLLTNSSTPRYEHPPYHFTSCIFSFQRTELTGVGFANPADPSTRCVVPWAASSRARIFSSRRVSATTRSRGTASRFCRARARSSALRARIAAMRCAMRDLELGLWLRAVVEVGQRHPGQRFAHGALDRPEVCFLLGRHEGVGLARRFGAAGPADAMDVVIRHRRHIEIDHVAEGFDVDAARGDVGGDEHPVLAALEPRKRLGPLPLRAVAVNPFGGDPMPDEVFRQAVGPVLRAREHERLLEDPA